MSNLKVGDLPTWAQEQAEECREMVNAQKAALDEIEGPLRKLAKTGDAESLNKREYRALLIHLRWDDEDFERFLNIPREVDSTGAEIPVKTLDQRLELTLANPRAFFYVDHQGKQHRVYIEAGKPVQILAEDHPDFE